MNEVPHPGFDKPEEYETFTTTNGLDEAAGKRLRRVCNLAEETKEDGPLEERLQELKEIRAKKDLDEAAKEYCPDDAYPFASDIINKEVRKAFIAGWKAKEESEKPVPNDLEEAADEMALRAFPEKKSYSTVYDRVVDYNAIDRKNYRDGIIAGAKWQKKQEEKQ